MIRKNAKSFDKDLKKITSYFGIETELMKLSEEIGELQNECYKNTYSVVNDNINEIEDECADVMVILCQIMLHYDVDIDKIMDTIEHKITRTIKRIEDGWYDKHR